MDKEALGLFFPQELLEHFEIVLVHELGHVEAKEDFIEVVFEERNRAMPSINLCDCFIPPSTLCHCFTVPD